MTFGLERTAVGAAAAIVLIVCAGCSTYARRAAGIRESFYRNELGEAERQAAAAVERDSSDADVLRLEQAMISLSSGRPAEAERRLREARDRFDALEEGRIAAGALSYLTDDQSRPYPGEDYEKVLLRSLLSLSNLLHDGGDAEAYSLQAIDKQEQIIAAGRGPDGQNPKAVYPRVALAPYLRGVLREASHHDYDDARRSFETVAAWQPDFLPARSDVERAAFGRHSQPGHGVLYLFALTGRGPYKEEAVEVPSSAALLIAGEIVSATSSQTVPPNVAPVKVPKVVARPNVVQAVAATVDGRAVGRSAAVCDVSSLAVQQYQAVQNQVVARAVARRIVKKGVIYGAKEATGMAKGSAAGLAVDLAGVAWEATEAADTRCWGLLPDQIQVLRVELPAGEHELRLTPVVRGAPGVATPPRRISVRDGDNTYVLAIFPGDRLVGQVVTRER